MCFTGHRALSGEEEYRLAPLLDQALEEAYALGFRRFFSGGAIGFDLLAAEAVGRLHKRHGDVRLILAIPCPDQSARWSQQHLDRYGGVLCLSDETRVLSSGYYEGCMMVRNRYMVDRAGLCLCYLHSPRGGTAGTVAYAMRTHVPLVNLAMPEPVAAMRRACRVTSEE